MHIFRVRRIATRTFAAIITAAGLSVTVLVSPSPSLTSPPDESVAFGRVYHLNRCVASRGEDEAILQVEGNYGWLVVGKGPFVRDADCAVANPKTPYTAPTATWEPTSTGSFALRLLYGWDGEDIASEPWAVKVTRGDQSELTRIRYRVKGCERCQIRPFRVSPRAALHVEYPAATVENGKAESIVPRRRTKGMAFAVNARRWNPVGSVPLVVTRYEGISPGERVNLRRALRPRKGTFCWAGTNKRVTTVRIRAQHIRHQPNPDFPDSGRSIFLWASPALKSHNNHRNMQPLSTHGQYFNGSPSC